MRYKRHVLSFILFAREIFHVRDDTRDQLIAVLSNPQRPFVNSANVLS